MKRMMMGVAILAPLAGCAYVNEPPAYARQGYVQPGYAPQGYVQQGYVAQPAYVQPGYGYATPAAPTGGYRDGSYEAERQAYEYGRRDGAAASRSW
ncbi:hypothetical protein [Falsiroseomonas oryzae]|uniref:hypothetical protein n=1 Tax=Falsiroseomonas oryzae TaxID=2766473 RepID=UPI0022EB45B7|nr:hypothetical protein [Roseomonas sp. MO-31]